MGQETLAVVAPKGHLIYGESTVDFCQELKQMNFTLLLFKMKYIEEIYK